MASRIVRGIVLLAGVGSLVGGLAVPAVAASATAAMTCSTTKMNTKTARGWCSGGSSWRVGVKCTDGKHYYSAWESDRRYQYATCGAGTITHYWIDN